MITDMMKRLACLDFVVSFGNMKHIIGDVATIIGVHFKNSLLSEEFVRSFRAENTSKTVRPFETVQNAILDAQHPENVRNYRRVLEQVQNLNPGMFFDGHKIWNMEETAVSAALGKSRE